MKGLTVRGKVPAILNGRDVYLPIGDYGVACPQDPATEGLLIFTSKRGKRYLVRHNSWRKGENQGNITECWDWQY